VFERIHSNLTNEVRIAIFAMLAITLAGCAGASVANQASNMPVSNNRPTTAYVYPFAVTAQDVTLNQGFFQKTYDNLSDENQTQSQLQIAQSTALAMANAMVQELQSLGFTARTVARGAQISGQNILIVDGEFTDINEGNRLRRMVIGLGVGASTLDTKVQVYQMANGTTQQIMDFTTHADSGEMPGAALTAPAGAAVGGTAAAVSLGVNLAAGAGKAYTSTTGVMAKRSADKAVAQMSQYFATQGWIPQSMVTTGSMLP
jgi:Domain of unknown function (DUF4410)